MGDVPLHAVLVHPEGLSPQSHLHEGIARDAPPFAVGFQSAEERERSALDVPHVAPDVEPDAFVRQEDPAAVPATQETVGGPGLQLFHEERPVPVFEPGRERGELPSGDRQRCRQEGSLHDRPGDRAATDEVSVAFSGPVLRPHGGETFLEGDVFEIDGHVHLGAVRPPEDRSLPVQPSVVGQRGGEPREIEPSVPPFSVDRRVEGRLVPSAPVAFQGVGTEGVLQGSSDRDLS